MDETVAASIADHAATTGLPVQRPGAQKVIDFVFFPLRALVLFHKSGFGLTSLADERFDYVARFARGHTLDIGCGRENRFVGHFLGGRGRGIDLFPYEGLTPENLVPDLTHLPFPDGSFDTVTFIANINHCPEPDRDRELSEAFRVLRPGGRIIVTMGHPVAEILVHKVVWVYDKLLGTKVDMDTERGMDEEEAYYLTDAEIRGRLSRAGFAGIAKKYFLTQWCLNHLFLGEKPGP
jgi:SAM-dependent methyltransferase